MTPAGIAGPDAPRLRVVPLVAAAIAVFMLLGWSVSGWGWLATWGGTAASSPWTIVSLLAVIGAVLAPPPARQWLAGAAIWMSTAALVGPEVVGTVAQTLWSEAPTRPAFGVDIAILLLAIGTWVTVIDVLDGLPTTLAAGAAAVANLSVLGRLTGDAWLATGGDQLGRGAMSFPTMVTLLLLALAIAARDRPRPFPLLAPISNATRWVVAVVAAIGVPLAVTVAQPATTVRGPGAFATTALLVVTTTLCVQLASVASHHRDALGNVVDIVEASPDATLFVDAEGTIVTANAAAEVIFATPRRALLGRSVDTLVPTDQRHLHRQHRGGFMQAPTSRRMAPQDSVKVARPDGSEFPAQVWLSALRLRNRPVIAATVRDVTPHTRQLEQLQSLQEMQEVFMMAISHELRTPLTVITGIAQTLDVRADDLPADRRHQLLGRLSAQARRLDEMIGELLDLERLRRGMSPDASPVDAGRLIASQARQSATERRLDVAVTTHPTLPDILADPVLLARVVDNLLSNAAKYAPGPVELRVTPHDDGILLMVDDHGPGVPVALREEIFQPFRRGDQLNPATPGVGVGLALVAGLATSTGGRAWVQPRDDGQSGASFRLHLPARPATPDPTASLDEHDPRTPSRPRPGASEGDSRPSDTQRSADPEWPRGQGHTGGRRRMLTDTPAQEASVSTIWQHDPEIDDPADFIGFTVEARDGQVGTIDDASWDTDTDHLVVDTGPWIFGKKVLIPAGLIELIDLDQETVHLALDKEQIKNGPEFDPDRHQDPSDDYWTSYDDYYGGLPPLV